MAEGRWSAPGAAYSAKEWLDTHHAIKSRLRSELVSKLPIYPGDQVVDLGCATGNWSMLIADRVGIRGKVTGIDINGDSLAIAHQRRAAHVLGKNIELVQANLEDLVLPPASSDVLLLFNVLSYIQAPEVLLKRVLGALKPGGRLVIKDSDLQGDFFWPVPFELYAKVMGHVDTSGRVLVEGNYDPFFARQVPALLRGLPALKVTTLSQAFTFFAPLGPEERAYVRANAWMVSELAAKNGGLDAARCWYELFDEANPNSVLDDPDFLFSTNEFVFQAVLSRRARFMRTLRM